MMGAMRNPPPISKPPKPIEFKRACEKCLWWELTCNAIEDTPATGRCHFYPPKQDHGFPSTWSGDWCEKFLRKRFDKRDNA